MKQQAKLQYTIRNIPTNIDRAFRQRMKAEGKSLNQVLVEALASSSQQPCQPMRDLAYLVGSLSLKDAENLEAEIKAQKTIDQDLWR